MSAILKSGHEKRISAIEITAMEVWLSRVLAGDLRGGNAALRTGLAFEHYEALLANDPSENTPEERAELKVRQEAFEAVVGERVEEMIERIDRRDPPGGDVR